MLKAFGWLTFLPEDLRDRMAWIRTLYSNSLSGDYVAIFHTTYGWRATNIDPSFVHLLADVTSRNARIEAAVRYAYVGNINMRHNVTSSSNVIPCANALIILYG